MASFSKGTSFTDGVTGDVTAAKLHALVDAATPVAGLVTDRTAKTSVVGADLVLVSDSADSNNLKKVTVTNFVGTLPTAKITTGTIDTATLGTTTGTLATLTGATITNGTIPTATLGTTTGTAATFTNGTLTTGVIPTGTFGTTTSTAATITSGTVATLNSTTGTIATLNSTTGTITTLNSTTGTIGNFTTTLAGDFTISGGTGTLGTTGVTAGTYGTNTAAVTLTLDAKGRVTTVSTSAISTTPAAGSITYPMLSTSGTESDNVAKRTAKAWVNFNGTGTPAIRDDFNVSSLTDHGSGDYTINFSTALASADYCAVGSQQSDPANGPDITGIFYARTPNTVSNPTTSGFRLSTMNAQSTPLDRAYVLVAVFL